MYCPENEEELQEESLPCEETPAEEVVEEAPAEDVVEETPAEEISVEEEPAAEETQEQKVEEVTEEEPAPVAPKKKKAWPWILGSIGLLLAAAVAFCVFWVNPYYAKKNAYEKAVAYLEERAFDDAREHFRKAEDYLDAATYYEDLQNKESLYLSAVADMEAGNYAEAGEVFDALSDYKDAAQKVQSCLLELALASLENHNMEDRDRFAHMMGETTYQQFLQIYRETYADLQVNAVIEAGLAAREQQGLCLYDLVKAEQEALAALDNLPGFADQTLEALVAKYREGVALQFGACTEGENGFENHGFYTGGYQRAAAIEELMESYGLLANTKALAEMYSGTAEKMKAYLDVQLALEDHLFDAQEGKGANGKTYQPFKNPTQVAMVVRFTQSFYNGGKYLGGNEAILHILPGETVYIPAEKWAKKYDDRTVTWEILQVQYGEELCLNPGLYKLQSMVVEDVFYDLEALAKENVTPDSVKVDFYTDGTGSWTEDGVATRIAYSEDLIAVDGTDLRLRYLVAPGKIVVYQDSGSYVLTLDTPAQ